MTRAKWVSVCLALLVVGSSASPQSPGAPQLPFDPCPFCQTATKLLDQQIGTAADVSQTITQTLAAACEATGPASEACLLFVAEYGGLFAYGVSVAQYSLDGFCPALFFCPPDTAQMMTQNGVFDTVCNVCKQTVMQILAAIGSERSQTATQALIETFCSAPLIDDEQCQEVFVAALTQTMGVTAAILDPESYCTLLGPCAYSTPAPAAAKPEEPAVAPEEPQGPTAEGRLKPQRADAVTLDARTARIMAT